MLCYDWLTLKGTDWFHWIWQSLS